MNSTSVILAIALVSTGIAFMPAAEAHYCVGTDPAQQCGDCKDILPHDHRYLDGSTYCRSSPMVSAKLNVNLKDALLLA